MIIPIGSEPVASGKKLSLSIILRKVGLIMVKFEIRVIYNDKVYVQLKEVKAKLGVSVAKIKKQCATTTIPGMGRTSYILETELEKISNDTEITIVYEVKNTVLESFKTSFKAGSFVYAMRGMKIPEEKIEQEWDKCKSSQAKRLEDLQKKIVELKKDQDKIDELNGMFKKLNTPYRIKQKVSLNTYYMSLSSDIYLTGGGYYKSLYSINNAFCIPTLDYAKENEEYIDNIDNNIIYLFEDDSCTELPIKCEVIDDVDYGKSHMEIAVELFQKNDDLRLYRECQDYVDFRDKDEKKWFSLTDAEFDMIFCSMSGRVPSMIENTKFDYSIEKAEGLVTKLKAIRFADVVANM